MLTHRDTEVMENLPTCIQMLPTSLQQCEAPNEWFKHNNKLRNTDLINYHLLVVYKLWLSLKQTILMSKNDLPKFTIWSDFRWTVLKSQTHYK